MELVVGVACCRICRCFNGKGNGRKYRETAAAVPAAAKPTQYPTFLAFCLALSLLGWGRASAASISSAQSGDWNAGTTWVGGVVPESADDVTIASGHIITIPVNASAATIVIADNLGAGNGLSISFGITLKVSGAITMTAPTAATSTINVGAGTLTAASLTIAGSSTAGRNCVVTVSTGTITILGSISFTGTAAQAQFISTGQSTVNVGGNFESGGTLTTSGTGTINFDGAGPQAIGTYTTFNNVVINNLSGGVTLTGTTTIGGALSVTTGTLTVGAYTLTVTGATTVTGRVAITSATGTKTFTGDVTINSGGTWDNSAGNEAIDLAGSLRNDGTLMAGTGVYTFTGAAKTIGGTGAVAIPNLTITGTVTNNGTLTVGTALSGAGTLTNGANATLNIGGSSGITTLTATAVPNVVNYNGAAQTVKPLAYYHLNLSGSGAKTLTNVATISGNLALSGTCNAATAIATTVTGSLTVGSGTTFTVAGFNLTVTGPTSVSGTLAHSSATGTKTFNGLVTIEPGGSWTNAGNAAVTFQGGLTHNGATFSSGTGIYTFATNGQTIDGSSAFTIANVTITGVTLTSNAANLTVSTALSGTGDMVMGTGATVNIGGTSTITTLDATAVGCTVNYSGAAQTAKPTTYYHLTLSGSGIKTLTNTGTINGNLTLSGTATATTAITTTVGGMLSVGVGTTLTIAGYNLSVTGLTSVSGTLAHSSAVGTKIYSSRVTVEPGGVWTNAGNAAITFNGGLTHNGATFSSGNGVYTFGANNQTVESVGPLTINSMTVNGVILTNNSVSLTVATALNGTGELRQETGAILNLGGSVGISTLSAATSPNTINYTGAAQAVKSAIYHHLTLTGSGTKSLPASSLTINGDFTLTGSAAAVAGASIGTAGAFTIGPSASFDAGSHTLDLKGSFNNNNLFVAGSGAVTFTGTSDQSVGGSATSTFNHLTVNKPGGNLQIATSCDVSGLLSLIRGNIHTDANLLAVTSSGSVTRTSGHVVGNLRMELSSGTTSRTFDIGDSSTYSPVSVAFADITADGDLTASVTTGIHPNIVSSSIDSVQDVNRYWTLTNGGIAFSQYTASFAFAAGDVDAGASPSVFKVGRFSGGSWTYPTVGAALPTSTEAEGLDGFGDFCIGEDRPDPPVLAAIGPQVVAEGDSLAIAVSATDPDGDSLVLAAEDLPDNASFRDNGDGTGELMFSPNYTQVATYQVLVTVSDGVMVDSEEVAIEVTEVNGAPIWSSVDSQTVAEGDTLIVAVNALDPDGDSLLLFAYSLPANAQFTDNGDGTGSLNFNPDSTQVGRHEVGLIASDGAQVDSGAIIVEVIAINRPPVLTPIDSQSVMEGDSLSVAIQANDSSSDSLVLTAFDLPANAGLLDNGDGSGVLSFAPDFGQAGEYSVTIIASDGLLADSELVTIVVTEHDSLTISGNAGEAGTLLTYITDTTRIATADGDGSYSFRVPYNWSGTVTPGRNGYAFTPAERTYAGITSDQTDQDYSASLISGVDEDGTGNVPHEYHLAQNYPNPFNPSTQISFGLPANSYTTLTVYNLLGQPVQVLADGHLAAGSYVVTWDGRGTDGHPVASGLYLYRLVSGDFRQTRKLMLLK